jgi:hypothetical protein
VSENRVLRRIFGPMREEVAGGWRRLHNEEFRNLYASNIIRVTNSRRMRWVSYVACTRDMRNEYNILVGKLEREEQFGRNKHRHKDNIRIDVREVVWNGMDWMLLAQERDQWRAVVKTVTNLWVPLKPGNFLTSSVIISFS